VTAPRGRTGRTQRRSPSPRLRQVPRRRRGHCQHAHRHRPAGRLMPHRRDQARWAPDQCEPTPRISHDQRQRRLLVASSCIGCKRLRDAKASLSCTFRWWQVMGSNHRRLSRRFYRERPPLTQTMPDVLKRLISKHSSVSSTTTQPRSWKTVQERPGNVYPVRFIVRQARRSPMTASSCTATPKRVMAVVSAGSQEAATGAPVRSRAAWPERAAAW
jgi:hypothetical protein